MSKRYKVFKNGVLVNTIIMEESLITQPSAAWDSYEEEAPPVQPLPLPVEVVVPDIKVSPIEFKLLFTSAERIAIKEERVTDPVVDDFYSIVEDPRLTEVNLSLTSTKNAIDYLVSKGLISNTRKNEILSAATVV